MWPQLSTQCQSACRSMSQSSISRGDPQGNTCAVFNVLCVFRQSFYMFLIIFRNYILYVYIYMCVCMCIYIYIYITIILYRITYYVYHVSLPWTKQLAFPTFSPPLAHPGCVVRQVSWSLAPWGPRNARGRRSLRGWSRTATSPATVGKSWGSTQRLKWSMEGLKGKSTGNHGFYHQI